MSALQENPDCITERDPEDMTALHWAGGSNNFTISQILLRAEGVDQIIRAKDKFGREPMDLVSDTGNERLADLYLQNLFPDLSKPDESIAP